MVDHGDEDRIRCQRSFAEMCSEMVIRDFMTKDLVTISENDSIDQILETFDKYHFHTYPVVNEDNVLVGTIDRDIILKILLVHRAPRIEHTHLNAVVFQGDTAKAIMLSHPVSISPDEHLCDAVDMMLKHKIDRFCIVDDGKLVGIICKPDIIKEVYKLRGSD
ncbi:CBS domain-containing protein [Methanococcoides sp.]|uniref:CBS domain-containing protein n=1 Tax=Methanococcoides sp. TaxID=1966350 RepID=UPI00272EDD78|nr:CBS domain-containing protein [Methanococcoides sp.]